MRLSQPPPNTPDKVEHGSGEDWYFDTFGNESELIWRNDYQNYVSNFIRHGSPNSKSVVESTESFLPRQ